MTAPEPREDVAVAEVLAAHPCLDPTCPGVMCGPDGAAAPTTIAETLAAHVLYGEDGDDQFECKCGKKVPVEVMEGGDELAWHHAHVAAALAPLIAERERAAVERARDESAVAEVGLTDAEWTRLRHAAGNRGDLGPIAEEVERILGERVSGDEAAIRQEREHCDQANRRADRWRERCDEARTYAANLEAERDALAAKVERAYALADVWEAENHPTSTIIARELRAALRGADQ